MTFTQIDCVPGSGLRYPALFQEIHLGAIGITAEKALRFAGGSMENWYWM